MASLNFTKSGSNYIATLPATSGVLQVEMEEQGKLQIVAAASESIDAVPVPFAPGVDYLCGQNILCKVSLDGVGVAKCVVTKEPTASDFESV